MSLTKILDALPDKTAAERARIRANAERAIAGGRPDQRSAAQAVLARLTELEDLEAAERDRRLSEMGLTQRVVEAFTREPPRDGEARIIRALLDNPGSTSAALSRACGYAGASAWHLRFGSMCRDRRADLWPAPPSDIREADFYCGVLADFDQATAAFTMKPEVARAFDKLGLRSRSASPPPGGGT